MLLEIARNMCHRGPLNSQELISHWYAEIKKNPPNEIEGSFFFAVWTGKPLFKIIILIYSLLLFALTLRGTVWVTLSTLINQY